MRYIVVVAIPEEDRVGGEGPAVFYGPFNSTFEANDWAVMFFGGTLEHGVFPLINPDEA